jgi:RNA polymerase sigma factor (sigma-70 family)
MWVIGSLSTNLASEHKFEARNQEKTMPDNFLTTTDAPNPRATWLDAAQNLEPEAWEELVKYFAGDLRHDIEISLRKRALPLDVVGDIEQETWLTAIKKIKEFHGEIGEKFYHWLRVISLNHIRTYWKAQSAGISMADFRESETNGITPDELLETRSFSETSLEEEIIIKERFLEMDRVLRTLSPTAQEIFMRWLMGETPRQLAVAFKIKPRSISQGIFRIKQQIQGSMGRKKGDDE